MKGWSYINTRFCWLRCHVCGDTLGTRQILSWASIKESHDFCFYCSSLCPCYLASSGVLSTRKFAKVKTFFSPCRLRTEMEVKWILVNIKYRLQYATECFVFHHFLFVRCASKRCLPECLPSVLCGVSVSTNDRRKETAQRSGRVFEFSASLWRTLNHFKCIKIIKVQLKSYFRGALSTGNFAVRIN